MPPTQTLTSNPHALSYPASESPDHPAGEPGRSDNGLPDLHPGHPDHRGCDRRPLEHRRQGRVPGESARPGQGPDVRSAAEPGLRQPQRELHLQQLRGEHQSRGWQPQGDLVRASRQWQPDPLLPPGADQALYRREAQGQGADLPRQHSGRRPREDRRRSPAGTHPPALGRRRDLHQRDHQAGQQPER
ncbi:hypothetical protein D9M72_408390 [compost metagenome]